MLKTTIKKINNNQYDLIGQLDAESVPEILAHTPTFKLPQNDTVIIDLKAVTHSSSAGIALLLEWLRQANKNQLKLQFTNMPVNMKAIAEICGLSDILPTK